jgi:hypothetical protein
MRHGKCLMVPIGVYWLRDPHDGDLGDALFERQATSENSQAKKKRLARAVSKIEEFRSSVIRKAH